VTTITEVQFQAINARVVSSVYLVGGFGLVAVIAGLVIGGGAAEADYEPLNCGNRGFFDFGSLRGK
jgi:hypothetical protein